MESETALANTLSNEFKTLMSGEKATKNGGARKNSRQQNQKKSNIRSCTSLPTGMNIISATTASAATSELEKTDVLNQPTLNSRSSIQSFSTTTLPSQVALEVAPPLPPPPPTIISKSEMKAENAKPAASSINVTTKSSASSIMQKNAMAKKENELKLKFVVEKIKSKLNSAQVAAASSNTNTYKSNDLNLQNKLTVPSQQQSSFNIQDTMDLTEQSIKLKVSPPANTANSGVHYQHLASSDFSNNGLDNHSHRQNSSYNLGSEDAIELYSPPTPPSSSNANLANPNSAKKNAAAQHVAKVCRIYDPDKHCGVTVDHTDPLTGMTHQGEPCLRSLTCKVI
jgi:hypothetical protein